MRKIQSENLKIMMDNRQIIGKLRECAKGLLDVASRKSDGSLIKSRNHAVNCCRKIRYLFLNSIKAIAVLLAGLTLTAGSTVAALHHGRGHRPHCPPPPSPRYHVAHHTHHHGGNVGWVALGTAAVEKLLLE